MGMLRWISAVSALLLVSPSFLAIAAAGEKPFDVVRIPIRIESNVFELMIDTGASVTMLSVVEFAKIQEKHIFERGYAVIGTGEKIPIVIYLVPSIVIGQCEIANVLVSPVSSVAPVSVLGMQALLQFSEFGFKNGQFYAMAPDGSRPCLPTPAPGSAGR